jgi:hypothetical protein
MSERKKAVKKEIKSNIRSISILIISLVLINLDISIAKALDFTENDRIIWALDLGIYNGIVGIIFSIIGYFFKERKLYVEVSILNKKEDINELTINGKEPEKIYVKIHIKGKYKKLSTPIVIFFPHWIDFQTKPKPYLRVIEDENKCLIDLEYLISKKENIMLTESITFDVINNSDEKNEDLIEAQWNLDRFTKFFKVDIENKGIKIRSK